MLLTHYQVTHYKQLGFTMAIYHRKFTLAKINENMLYFDMFLIDCTIMREKMYKIVTKQLNS